MKQWIILTQHSHNWIFNYFYRHEHIPSMQLEIPRDPLWVLICIWIDCHWRSERLLRTRPIWDLIPPQIQLGRCRVHLQTNPERVFHSGVTPPVPIWAALLPTGRFRSLYSVLVSLLTSTTCDCRGFSVPTFCSGLQRRSRNNRLERFSEGPTKDLMDCKSKVYQRK